MTSTNAVSLVESDAYARFHNEVTRQTFLIQIAHSVIEDLLHGSGRADELVHALARAAGERRLLVWSAVPAEEARLAASPLGGVVAARGPYAFLVVNDGAGNKLDYYLARTLRYTAGGCHGATRTSRITVTLENTAPAAGLPAYVAGPPLTAGTEPGYPPGTEVSILSLYLTPGAQLLSATDGGEPLPVAVATQDGLPVLTVTIATPSGAGTTLVFELIEPTLPGPATVPVQPLVLPQHTSVDVAACRGR